MNNTDYPATVISADGFVAYEYTKVQAPHGLEALYLDTYRSFGWVLDDTASGGSAGTVTLSLKRDRSIRNRPMVQELQRKAVASLGNISRWERSKTSVPTTIAITLGVLGCIPLAGAVFMITGAAARFLSTLLGIIGLVMWGAGAALYLRLKRTRTINLDARIDKEQDIVFDAGAQAARLLH